MRHNLLPGDNRFDRAHGSKSDLTHTPSGARKAAARAYSPIHVSGQKASSRNRALAMTGRRRTAQIDSNGWLLGGTARESTIFFPNGKQVTGSILRLAMASGIPMIVMACASAVVT